MFVGAAIGLLASVALPIGQRSWAHRQETGQSRRHFRYDCEMDKQRHREKLGVAASQFKAQQTSTLQYYSEDMAVALDLARRETVRDVWVQRSMLNQTIMLNGALMLSCAFENFSQSLLPRTDVPMQVGMLYALNGTLGLAIFLCTVCIVFCLNMQERLGWYALGDPLCVYHCGKVHPTFNDYFDCHCESIRNAADWIFYAGGACTIISSILLQAIKFASNHPGDAPVIIAIFAITAGLGVVVLPFLHSRYSVGGGRGLSAASGGVIDYGGLGGATEEEQQQQQQRQAMEEEAARRERRRGRREAAGRRESAAESLGLGGDGAEGGSGMGGGSYHLATPMAGDRSSSHRPSVAASRPLVSRPSSPRHGIPLSPSAGQGIGGRRGAISADDDDEEEEGSAAGGGGGMAHRTTSEEAVPSSGPPDADGDARRRTDPYGDEDDGADIYEMASTLRRH